MNPMNPSNQFILLTVDVEDWFQVENLRPCCPVSSWSSHELRVERNTHRLLDLLDSIKMKKTVDSRQKTVGRIQKTEDGIQNASSNSPQSPGSELLGFNTKSSESCLPAVCLAGKSCLTSPSPPQAQRSSSEAIFHPSRRIRATFFVLGWIAERLPNLVREIHARGHEVASHGYGHELCSQSSIDDLKEDLAKSKKLLEDIIGERVYGYRAPSFSISDEILKLIEEAGYEYDSSYNSFGMHGRYGKISLNGNRSSGIAILLNQKSTIENRKFYELPISNLSFRKPFSYTCPVKFFKKDSEADLTEELSALSSEQNRDSFVLPWGGGAYFRLIPAPLFRIGVREILRQQQAYLFYMHPWEVDPEQPRPAGTTAFSRFKHYTNLSKTEGKLRSLLRKFSECSFVGCHEHLEQERTRNSVEPPQLNELK